jgi:hypothetical protein
MNDTDNKLGEKWGIVPWLTIRIDEQPEYLKELVLTYCDDNKLAKQGVCDLAFVAPTSAAVWKQKARRLKPAIDPDGTIWVLYPRDEFKEKYRFDGSLDEMVAIVKDLGLKKSKTISVNDELVSISFRLREIIEKQEIE